MSRHNFHLSTSWAIVMFEGKSNFITKAMCNNEILTEAAISVASAVVTAQNRTNFICQMK